MKNTEQQLTRAIEALNEIAAGHANNGVPYFAGQLRTIAQDALAEIRYIQYQSYKASKQEYHCK